MIINERMEIQLSNRNISYYRMIYGDNNEIGDTIEINVNNLPTYSKIKIKVKCDYCNLEKYIAYKSYYKNTKSLKCKYCCEKCKYNKISETNLIKYGVKNVFELEDIKEKSKKTFLEKYGVEHPLQSDTLKQKSINTCLGNYGVYYPLQSEELKNKQQKTNLKKYGYNVASKSDIVKKHTIENNIKKYGVEHPMMLTENIDKLINTNNKKYGYNSPILNNTVKNKSDITLIKNHNVTNPQKSIVIRKNSQSTKIYNLKTKFEKLGINILDINYEKNIYTIECSEKHIFEITSANLYNRININTTLCTCCNPINSYRNSGYEIQLQNFIKTQIKAIQNTKKIIPPYELDIYIPELNLAYEFDGLWWHNELYKDKNYHLNKTNLCEKNGIRLMHIFEDDWLYKNNIIKSMILKDLGKIENIILKTEIREIYDDKIVESFLEENHIQGYIKSKIKIGLFYDNELVTLIIFDILKNKYELLRFCNKLNTIVIDGDLKLFNYFIEKYNPIEIVSYSDRSFSQDILYEKLGFNVIKKLPPSYYYVINNVRKNKYEYRKQNLVKCGFDPNKSEHDIMLDRKIYRIYDSGKLKYIYRNEKINHH